VKICARETYAVKCNVLHRLQPLNAQAGITLVLTHPEQDRATTIGPFDGPDVLSFSRVNEQEGAGELYRAIASTEMLASNF
jgi:hypothetical protein